MGCLNSTGQFDHWFGNIHLSGPCNRACYFCIGQHMMALDSLNNLDTWPMPGLGEFITACQNKKVREINLTGTNTDPMLFRHIRALDQVLRSEIPGLIFGVRTNGARGISPWFDKASVSVTTLDRELYRATMGTGLPPDLGAIRAAFAGDLKVNVVLCPEVNAFQTIHDVAAIGIERINLREPYGQPRVGNPFKNIEPDELRLGMPVYRWRGAEITYWDVHYVEVESVNLYASGRVSVDYPITRGHDDAGLVQDQGQFNKSGRVRKQWQTVDSTSEMA